MRLLQGFSPSVLRREKGVDGRKTVCYDKQKGKVWGKIRMDQEYLDLKKWLKETADEPLETMNGFFDRRIAGYEEHMSPWREHYRWLAQLLPEDSRTLLDIGCGSGLELDEIFLRFPQLAVTGIDLSQQMLALLQKKHGARALTLIRADYFVHPFGEQRFDAAVSFETLHHFTAGKKTALFKKLCHALRPGGVYLECDYIASSQEIEELVFAESERRRQRDKIPPEQFVHFDTPLTLEHELQALREAGFSSAELVGYLPGDNHTPMLRAVK
jgi:tRNA (cmo5U34)-methyltransferase